MREEDFGIFQNQEEVVDNIKDAASAVGASAEGIDKLKEGKPLEFFVARKNCKQCWGRGLVDFVPNEIGSSTIRPEDRMGRKDKMTKALCKCVKIQME